MKNHTDYKNVVNLRAGNSDLLEHEVKVMELAGLRRILLGKPLKTDQAIHERLNIPRALAVFSSDALSSTTYATEAILLVLIAAGTAAIGWSWWITLGIIGLLIIVGISYFQTIHAYPNGGGAYIVARTNLGSMPGLVAAASLLIDYILTVAVSVSASTAALVSAFPELNAFRVEIALLIITFVTVMNLRGVKESGTFFAIPTYAFVAGMLLMIALGLLRLALGQITPMPTPTAEQLAKETTGALTLYLFLRAFAAGCTALTGIEAISNGITAFKPPESRNAGRTLIIMIVLLGIMFAGTTFLANKYQIVALHGADVTVLSMIARATFGGENLLFYFIQLATLLILALAANTAYADFPRLASLIARDRYLPRQLSNLGDRLVFSNGIILLAVIAGILVILFDAREHNLLPLYAVGVFLGFSLSQTGMVIHWLRARREANGKVDRHWWMSISVNAVGAVLTSIVLVILMTTKFAEGAWVVIITVPLLVVLFLQIHRHYERVARSLSLDGLQPGPIRMSMPDRSHVRVVVLMNSLNRCSLQSLEYAMRVSDDVRACCMEIEPDSTGRLLEKWKEWDLKVPLDVVPSPYREVGQPLVDYLHRLDQTNDPTIPTVVVLPEFVVSHWWERYLHNQTSVVIREALYRDQIASGRGRPVISVPYRIGDTLYQPIAVIPTTEGNSADTVETDQGAVNNADGMNPVAEPSPD